MTTQTAHLVSVLILAGMCLPIFIAALRNHHNKWAIIVLDAVPVITYASGYLVLRGPHLTPGMVLWLAGFGVSVCIWLAAFVWACTRVNDLTEHRKVVARRSRQCSSQAHALLHGRPPKDEV